MACTTIPCTISGLDPCVNYNITITPTNNCGSATGCTGSMVAAKGYNLGVYAVYFHCMLLCMSVSECYSDVRSMQFLPKLIVHSIPAHKQVGYLGSYEPLPKSLFRKDYFQL